VRRTSCRDFADFLSTTRTLIAALGPRLAPSPGAEKGNSNRVGSLSQNQPTDST
jgi:hypothetical protein